MQDVPAAPQQPSQQPTITGSPVPSQPNPARSAGDGQLVTTVGFILLGGIAVLLLSVALRFLRRAADPETHGFGKRRPTRGFERGRGVDPWREAGRRIVLPPKAEDSEAGDGDDGDENDDEPGARR